MAYCPRLLAAFDRWRAIMSFVPVVEGCGGMWVGVDGCEKTVQAVVVVDVRAVSAAAAAVLLLLSCLHCCCYLAVLHACVLST